MEKRGAVMKVLVHIDDAEQWRDALAARLPEAEVITSQAPAEKRREVDYLAVWKPPEALLREPEALKGIVNLGAGVDALLGNPGLPAGVPIVKLRDAAWRCRSATTCATACSTSSATSTATAASSTPGSGASTRWWRRATGRWGCWGWAPSGRRWRP